VTCKSNRVFLADEYIRIIPQLGQNFGGYQANLVSFNYQRFAGAYSVACRFKIIPKVLHKGILNLFSKFSFIISQLTIQKETVELSGQSEDH